MRDIKFRAWDKGNMVQQPISSIFGMARFLGFVSDDAILMQYTGLKDKNGKEIYEGDIVIVDGLHTYVVQWVTELEYEEKCSGWGLEVIRAGYPPFLYDTWAIDTGKIIGNIYENPELLKDPK